MIALVQKYELHTIPPSECPTFLRKRGVPHEVRFVFGLERFVSKSPNISFCGLYKNNTIYKNDECYITLSPNSNYVTHIDFFIADLEVGDNIRIEILKPFQPHKLFVAVSGLFPRTSLTVVKIF